MEEKELAEEIERANKAYREGNPIMSDGEWDLKMDMLREMNPNNPLVNTAVIEGVKGKSRVQKLPYPMFSLEKVKSLDELNTWLREFSDDEEFIITPKYDGISLLSMDDEKVWTRGDGREGQLSIDRFRHMCVGEKIYGISWGEAIMKKSSFMKYLESGEYKTARNMVAGQFTGDNFNERVMEDIDFVRYGMGEELDKEKQLQLLGQTCYVKITKSGILNASAITFDELFAEMGDEYNIDGLVIEVNKLSVRRAMGRHINGNPKYAVALKLSSWNEKKMVRVKDIKWQISKDGCAIPVIEINPIELSGVTVTNISGYNASYIVDNHICKGALIEVCRSGEVIPKHLSTVEYNDNEYRNMMDEMIVCPSCGEVMKWDKNYVDLVCEYPDCEQKIVSEMLFFFKTMNIEEVGRPTIQKLYNAGYRSVHSILLDLNIEDWVRIDGFGKESFYSLKRQLSGIGKVPLARLLTALNIFHGELGEKVCQLIFNTVNPAFINNSFLPTAFPLEVLLSIKGVGELTARSFIKGMREFSLWGKQFPFEFFDWYVVEKQLNREDAKRVCFSGFRDKQFEEKIKEMGHKVVSGVSEKLDLLIVKDLSSNSSKTTTARELGVKILTAEQWDDICEFLK